MNAKRDEAGLEFLTIFSPYIFVMDIHFVSSHIRSVALSCHLGDMMLVSVHIFLNLLACYRVVWSASCLAAIPFPAPEEARHLFLWLSD